MIFLFCGDDAKRKLTSYEKFLKSLSSEAEVFFISRNNFDRTQIENLYSGSALFFTKAAVVFSGILEYEETRDFVMEKLSQMEKSPSSFVFLEGKLNKPILDMFKKSAINTGRSAPAVNIFELPKAQKEKFDNFLVANAFEKKDKLNMWIYFREAVTRGVVMEEIVGVLFWKIKDMILKKNYGKFSEAKLKDLASRLSYLLPEARKKGLDAESAFERFLLEAF